jgi:hypothetical protein
VLHLVEGAVDALRVDVGLVGAGHGGGVVAQDEAILEEGLFVGGVGVGRGGFEG